MRRVHLTNGIAVWLFSLFPILTFCCPYLLNFQNDPHATLVIAYLHLCGLFFLVVFVWGTQSTVIDENGASFYILGIQYRAILWKNVVHANIVYTDSHYGYCEGVLLTCKGGLICQPNTIKTIDGVDIPEPINNLIYKNKDLRLALRQGRNIYIVGKKQPNKKWSIALEIMRENISDWGA